jgi:hypothetical protein
VDAFPNATNVALTVALTVRSTPYCTYSTVQSSPVPYRRRPVTPSHRRTVALSPPRGSHASIKPKPSRARDIEDGLGAWLGGAVSPVARSSPYWGVCSCAIWWESSCFNPDRFISLSIVPGFRSLGSRVKGEYCMSRPLGVPLTLVSQQTCESALRGPGFSSLPPVPRFTPTKYEEETPNNLCANRFEAFYSSMMTLSWCDIQ